MSGFIPCLAVIGTRGRVSVSKCGRRRASSYEVGRQETTHSLRMKANDEAGGSADGNANSGTPDGSTLTQALEVSFRNVWIRLMTSGVGQEYHDAIAAFVVTAMAAYKAGYSINALKFELSANEKVTEYMGRDVSLNDQEKQTRLIWIVLVYLTLARYNFACERPIAPVKDDVKGSKLEGMMDGLTSLVESIIEAERKGYTLATFKMELAMQKEAGEKEALSQSQANIRSQWSRIVFVTLGLIPGSRKQ